MSRIQLVDDGTLDTVLRCSECGEQFRYNFDPTLASYETSNANESYEEFVDRVIEEAEEEHECEEKI